MKYMIETVAEEGIDYFAIYKKKWWHFNWSDTGLRFSHYARAEIWIEDQE